MRLVVVALIAGIVTLPASLAAAQSGVLVNDDAFGIRTTPDGVSIVRQVTLQNRFSMEIDGVVVAGVHSIEGLEHEHEVVEYKDGEDLMTNVRPRQPGSLTLAKDWTTTSEWFLWWQHVMLGINDRRSVSIIFHNDAGEEAMRLTFFDCLPTSWTGPSLNARTSAHATERIEISWEVMALK